MNNILTPEESAQFVTYGDLMKIMEELGKAITNITEQQDEDASKTIDRIIDIMAEIEYKRVRDLNFCMQLIADFGYISHDRMVKRYNSWCEEYDKLNKENEHEG